jgi:hypothetical protein
MLSHPPKSKGPPGLTRAGSLGRTPAMRLFDHRRRKPPGPPFTPRMSARVQVVPLSRTPEGCGAFPERRYAIYREDPKWVAPLLMDLKKVFTDRNPSSSTPRCSSGWPSMRDVTWAGLPASRIARSTRGNRSHRLFRLLRVHRIVRGQRSLVSGGVALGDATRLIRIIGPMNPSGNDECGLLVQGFEFPPVFMMPYNPRYYLELVDRAGFQKSKDLVAFDIDLRKTPMQRLERVAARFAKRQSDIHSDLSAARPSAPISPR